MGINFIPPYLNSSFKNRKKAWKNPGLFDFYFFILLIIFLVKKSHILLLVILKWKIWSSFSSTCMSFYKELPINILTRIPRRRVPGIGKWSELAGLGCLKLCESCLQRAENVNGKYVSDVRIFLVCCMLHRSILRILLTKYLK